MKTISPKHVVVGVRDSGSGITAKYSQGLFTKFAKLHQGTGLGFLISKNIVEGYVEEYGLKNNEDGNSDQRL